MSNIVFILGAGASASCGAPLMYNFLDTAAQLLATAKVDDKKEHYERVFKAISNLQIIHSKSQLDLNNIESIFTTFEMARTLNKFPGIKPDEIENIIISLKEVIVQTLQRSIQFPVLQRSICIPDAYDSFMDLCRFLTQEAKPNNLISFITFNYDILLDFMLNIMRKMPNYGFNLKQTNSASIPLLKLHGSLNWAFSKSDHEILPCYLYEYDQHFKYNGFKANSECIIPIGSQLVEFFQRSQGIEVLEQPVIVPPSWNKAEYQYTLKQVWAAAATELCKAEYIYIIGYSLSETDTFFKLLFALGTVSDILLKKIVIINPETNGVVRSRFEFLLGSAALDRFHYEPVSFENCFDFIRKIHTY